MARNRRRNLKSTSERPLLWIRRRPPGPLPLHEAEEGDSWSVLDVSVRGSAGGRRRPTRWRGCPGSELVDRTGVRLLIDVANLHTNHVNRGEDPSAALDELPVEAIAYVHVAGGVEKNGVWHDTHAHPVTRPILDILTDLRSRTDPPGVLLERDDNFPSTEALAAELTKIRKALTPPPPPRPIPTPVTPPATPLHGEARAGARAKLPAHGEALATARPDAPAASLRGEAREGGGLGLREGAGWGDNSPAEAPARREPGLAAGRTRVALAQASLLSALVAGTPIPAGFDSARLRVQSRALAGKRADVVAKVAPELREILGPSYRAAFLAYAKSRPMATGYRRDALDFAEHVLATGRPEDEAVRKQLTHWWQDRAAPRPPSRSTRFVRAARAALVRK
ncbi:DUF692 family protein [Streptomyces sp. ISL-100]|nr:DUF692 family protein [Streptomyces sp. ISL-100]